MKNTRIDFSGMAAAALLLFSAWFSLSGRLAAQAPAAPTPPAAAPAEPPAAPATAPAAAVSKLTVQITGIRNGKGWINVALFKDGIGFPTSREDVSAAMRVPVDAKTLTATAVFDKLPQGVYAAAVLHDEAMIGKMEYDAQGIPLEGYGISNNPDTSLGPPSAKEAEFHVDRPECTIQIKMVYWQ